MKKKIAVISPDAFIGKSYYNLTLASKRALQLSNLLSQVENFEVTLLSPLRKDQEIQYPFNNEKLNFDYYSFSAAFYSWSEELDKKLLKYDFIIIQASTGVGFQNCTVLPKKINVIVDAWLPMVAQYPVDLLIKHRIKRRFTWDTFLPQYKSLLQRANCVLCANEKQRHFYEGQFFMIEKLGWDAFKFSPIHKVPYIFNTESPMETTTSPKDKIVWYGDIHQFDSLVDFIKVIKNTGIKLDIIYRTNDVDSQKNKYSLLNLMPFLNENIVLKDADNVIDFSKYYLGVYLNNNWLEDTYSNNCDVFELLFKGIPVVTNNYLELYQEYPYLINNGIFYTPDAQSVLSFIEDKTFTYSQKAMKSLREYHSSDNAATSLINYIKVF